MGLNESYIGIRTQILMIDPLPNVSKVFNLVIQEEIQCMIGADSSLMTKSMAFSVSSVEECIVSPGSIATMVGGRG